MNNNETKIIIADDHALFAEGLKLLLSQIPHMQVVGIAKDGRELLEMSKQLPADMVLLDINMPDINGFDTTRYLKMRNASLKIIILSTYSEIHVIAKARELGADGYVIKNSNRQELTTAINTVLKGEQFFQTLSKLCNLSKIENDPFLKSSLISKRERDIIQLIKLGKTNKEVANNLSLSVYTVETHRKNIMRKLELKSPAALMKFILENNL